MKLTVRLFIQRHENRSYTVSVPIFPGVAAYGTTPEECKQEIAEALAKRLAEVDPELLHTYAFKSNQRLEKVTAELRPIDRNNRHRRNALRLTISLLLTPEEDGQILVTAPRLRFPPLTFYIARAEELQEIAQLELAQYFHDEPIEVILALQASRHEMLDTLEVEFRPKKATDKEDEEQEERFWALKASGTNLHAKASEGQLRRAFRREALVDQILGAIASERRPSILLVGPSGVGKTALVYEIARRIAKKECPEALHDRQIWSVTGDSLIAGCSYIGQWQEKLADLVREVRKKRHILFVEDVAALSEAGRWSKGDQNMAEFLKPHIQSGDLVVIGESTPERLRYLDRMAPGFAAQFRTLEIPATTESDTLSILAALARDVERLEDLRIEPSALEAANELTSRFQPYRAQPGAAVVLLEQLAGDAARTRTATTRPTITRREVVAGFTRQSGLPEFIVTDSMPLDLAGVAAHFSERIIGQPAAVKAMVDLIAMVKAGLNDPGKPLGVYLFIGPTGVGKTQLAKTLAAYLFGDEARMLRFDMSEYSDPAAVRRLIGVLGGGREAGEGELTRRVRAQPFCVLLLDEFEKADP
jgi:ATP-dependent Clp protease ATP-binding subunit ClpC